MVKKNFLIVFSAIFFALLFSRCTQHSSQENAIQKIESIQFDSIEANNLFYTESPQSQWRILTKAVQNNYTNQAVFEDWALNKLPILLNQKHSIDAPDLRKLNDDLYHSSYNKLGYKIARFTLKNTYSHEHKNTYTPAVAVLCAHFNFLKQKDSLQKYVDQLHDLIQLDTLSWLHLAYYSNKGNVEDLNGRYFNAVVSYNKAIEKTDPQDKKNLSTLYQNLATMYLNMEYIDKALAYMNHSVELVCRERFPIDNLMTLGVLYFRSGDYENAEKTYTYILDYAIKNGQSGLIAQTYSNLGNLKNKQEQTKEALHYLHLSDSICAKLGIDIGLFINLINRTQVYYNIGDYEKAIAGLHEAEAQATIFKNPKINTEIYENLSKAYEAIGNANKANQYFRYHIESKQKILGDLPRSIIAEWELSREKEKATKANSELEAIVQKQIKNKIIFALLLCILIIFASIFYFYKQRKHTRLRERYLLHNQQIKYDLEIKSKEILSESLKNISIQTTKEWILKELQEIVKELPRTQQFRFTQLTKKLKSGNRQTYLNEFDIRFTGVYEEFYDKIKTFAPSLTANELRICAMMRLNISSKEIATLTNRTTGTIENIRSDIRKKLNVPSHINLQDFILKL